MYTLHTCLHYSSYSVLEGHFWQLSSSDDAVRCSVKTEFDVRAVTHVVWAYATLGKYDQTLFDVCADSAAKLVDTASPQVSPWLMRLRTCNVPSTSALDVTRPDKGVRVAGHCEPGMGVRIRRRAGHAGGAAPI